MFQSCDCCDVTTFEVICILALLMGFPSYKEGCSVIQLSPQTARRVMFQSKQNNTLLYLLVGRGQIANSLGKNLQVHLIIIKEWPKNNHPILRNKEISIIFTLVHFIRSPTIRHKREVMIKGYGLSKQTLLYTDIGKKLKNTFLKGFQP